MAELAAFKEQVILGYQFKGEHFQLGIAMLDGQAVEGTPVLVPLQTMNRHGLVAGATGTGKTKHFRYWQKDSAMPVFRFC